MEGFIQRLNSISDFSSEICMSYKRNIYIYLHTPTTCEICVSHKKNIYRYIDICRCVCVLHLLTGEEST